MFLGGERGMGRMVGLGEGRPQVGKGCWGLPLGGSEGSKNIPSAMLPQAENTPTAMLPQVGLEGRY